jgi:DHA2 family multidrug resistance protein-like MFS transporter
MAAVVVGVLLAGGLGLGPTPLFVACALAVLAALCSMARYRSVTQAGATMASLRET